MFIDKVASGYTKDGSQWARGPFMIVFCYDEFPHALRACIRTVRLRQLGHWMMGDVSLNSHKIVLSGDFGGDGLPNELAMIPDYSQDIEPGRTFQPYLPASAALALWKKLLPVPEELAEIYWKDDTGHNCVGNSRTAWQRWGKTNLKALKTAGR